MATFPQLSSGALAQYPIRKRTLSRTITNISEDQHVISLADTNAVLAEWDLQYYGLTDAEVSALLSFFQICEGALQPFTFLDPTANLFLYSEDYSQPAWQRNSLLTLSTGVSDPLGSTRASLLTNSSTGTIALTQTVRVAGSVWASFSAYLSSAQPISVQLTRSDGSNVRAQSVSVTPAWQRFYLSSVFNSSISPHCDFSITLPPGESIRIFGAQLEAQPYPGKYVQNIAQSGIYPNSRFANNSLTITADSPGQSSASVSIISKANS